MTVPVILLDIDGVLNTLEEYHGFAPPIERQQVAWLKLLCKETDAHVVVISTWRSWTHLGWLSVEGWRVLFNTHGADIVVDAVIDKGQKREQVAKWLAANKPEKWVILDDWADVGPHQVRIRWESGLTEAGYIAAKRWLA